MRQRLSGRLTFIQAGAIVGPSRASATTNTVSQLLCPRWLGSQLKFEIRAPRLWPILFSVSLCYSLILVDPLTQVNHNYGY